MPARARGIVGLILAVCLWPFPAGRVQSADPETLLVLERTIRLDGVAGRIDHMAIDLGRKRLMVAELGNDSVDVIDLIAGKPIHRIVGLKEPQGIGYLPGPDLILVADGGDGSVRLFKGEDGSPVGVIDLGDDPDNVRVDPHTGYVVVGYGDGGLATIDAATRKKVADVRLQAHPEGFQLDAKGGRAFANVPGARQIAVVDLATGGQAATWKVPNLAANFPLAIDETGTVLATVFRDPARLVLLDANTGSVSANLETCGDADDVFFDTKRQRIYISCGAGRIDVFQQAAAGYQLSARVNTPAGARTSLFVPQLDRLFVAARAGLVGSSSAAILVFRPVP